MFAKAKAGLVVLEAKAKSLRGQGQGQWSLRPTKKDMFKAQVFFFYCMSTFFHNKIISTAMKSIHETVHSSVPFYINTKYQCRIINAAVAACDPGQQY